MRRDKEIYKWVMVVNVVIIVVTAALFYLTRSAWCFLFLLVIAVPRSEEAE